MEFVLKDAFVQVPADPDIKRAGKTGHDVHAVISAIAHVGILGFFFVGGGVQRHIFWEPFPKRDSWSGRDASTARENRFALLLLRSA